METDHSQCNNLKRTASDLNIEEFREGDKKKCLFNENVISKANIEDFSSSFKKQGYILSERDLHIVIDEDKHEYYVNNVKCKLSSTTLKSTFFNSFNYAERLAITANKNKKDPEQVRSEWNMSGYYGTKVHLFIENFLNKLMENAYFSTDNNEKTRILSTISAEVRRRQDSKFVYEDDMSWLSNADFKGKEIFKNNQSKESADLYLKVTNDFLTHYECGFIPWQLIACEYMIYGTLNGGETLCGTIDALFWSNKDKREVIIVDWKTNRSQMFKSNQKSGIFIGEQKDTLDQFACQLHIYKYILEKYYNVSVVACAVVHLKKDCITSHTFTSDCICKGHVSLI